MNDAPTQTTVDEPLHQHSNGARRRRLSRLAVLVLGLIGAALFYWQGNILPLEHQLIITLTGVEKSHQGELLRYEQLQSLEIRFVDKDGRTLATTEHTHPSAVAKPASVRIPNGEYLLHFTLRFHTKDNSTAVQSRLIKTHLEGGEHRIEL